MLSQLLQELRQALRGLRRRPGFSLIVIWTLSLGIGATAVVFDLLNLTLWRQAPGLQATEGLVRLHTRSHMDWVGAYGGTSYPDLVDYRATAVSFEDLAGSFRVDRSLDLGDQTELVQADLVTASYFQVLGVPAALGYLPGNGKEKDTRSASSDASDSRRLILSHQLWLHLFQGDPRVLGRTVQLDGQSYTITGVAAEGFDGTSAGDVVDLWLLLEEHLDEISILRQRDRPGMSIFARLRAEVPLQQARQELQLLADGLEAEYPHPRRRRQTTIVQVSYMHPLDQNNFLPSLRLLAVGVALLLLLTCANAANLLLVRGTARGRELAIRAALGASRASVLRPLLFESLLLTTGGALLGLLLAMGLRRLVAWQFDTVSAMLGAQLNFDARFLVLITLCTLTCAVLCALPPMVRAWRTSLVPALKDGSSTAARGAAHSHLLGRLTARASAGDALVVAQVTLCMVLLTATGLLTQSLRNLWHADAGFDATGILATRPTIARNGYPQAISHAYYQRLLDGTASLPGVTATSLALFLPPILVDVTVDIHLPEDPETAYTTRINIVDQHFFDVLHIPIARGRTFDTRDPQLRPDTVADEAQNRGAGTVIISQALADLLWPGQDPIGRILRLPPRQPQDYGPDHRVIGVAADTSQDSLRRPSQPILYFSAEQRFRTGFTLLLRSSGDPYAHLPALRDRLRQLDPTLALQNTRTGDETRRAFLVLERIRSQSLALFATFGLLLALIGTGSVLAYHVSRRVREIGIRMALGADGPNVRWLVLRRGLFLTITGIALGAIGAAWGMRLLHSFLYGVGSADPWIFASVAVVLLATSLTAAWLPARRASRMDPLVALREE